MKTKEKIQARKLRINGATIDEIAKKLHVSKGSVSVWVRDVTLPLRAQKILKQKKVQAQKKSSIALRKRTRKRENEASLYADNILNQIEYSKNNKLALLAIYYWCEGNKSPKDMVMFTNSDPEVIKAFLSLLRSSFVLEESRFRVSMHLHAYHNVQKELLFWSKTTGIPLSQFFKPYSKKNTGRQKRVGYRGCAQIKYYDISVARKLLALGSQLTHALANKTK